MTSFLQLKIEFLFFIKIVFWAQLYKREITLSNGKIAIQQICQW